MKLLERCPYIRQEIEAISQYLQSNWHSDALDVKKIISIIANEVFIGQSENFYNFDLLINSDFAIAVEERIERIQLNDTGIVDYTNDNVCVFFESIKDGLSSLENRVEYITHLEFIDKMYGSLYTQFESIETLLPKETKSDNDLIGEFKQLGGQIKVFEDGGCFPLSLQPDVYKQELPARLHDKSAVYCLIIEVIAYIASVIEDYNTAQLIAELNNTIQLYSEPCCMNKIIPKQNSRCEYILYNSMFYQKYKPLSQAEYDELSEAKRSWLETSKDISFQDELGASLLAQLKMVV